MKTVLITGCSSGFGLETASYFLDRGWKVIATMRSPRNDLLPQSENLVVLPLDVTDDDSVRHAIAAAGPIDVLVNNAGIGWLNALEGTPLEIARSVFEIVLPGAAPDTSFGSTALSKLQENGGFPAAYAGFANEVIAAMRTPGAPRTRSADVAEAVWRAATDPSTPMRIPAGADAVALTA